MRDTVAASGKRVVAYGRSLGTGLAAAAAHYAAKEAKVAA